MGDLTNSNERIDLLAKIEKSIEHCKTSSSKIEGIHKLIKLLEAEKLFFNKVIILIKINIYNIFFSNFNLIKLTDPIF